MPLVKGSSREAISKNIDELTHHGSRQRPHDQIVAIALSEADKSKRGRRADGGNVPDPSYDPAIQERAFKSLADSGQTLTPANTPDPHTRMMAVPNMRGAFGSDPITGNIYVPWDSRHPDPRQHRAAGGGGLSSVIPGIQDDPYHSGGLFNSDVAGRTDRLPHTVAADSFVMPADAISILGQGNTPAGAKIMDGILGSGPYGTQLPRGRRADGGNATDKGVSHVMVAGGEVLVPRERVQNVGWRSRNTGKQSPQKDLTAGHAWLRDFVAKIRKYEIGRLKNAPKPKK